MKVPLGSEPSDYRVWDGYADGERVSVSSRHNEDGTISVYSATPVDQVRIGAHTTTREPDRVAVVEGHNAIVMDE